MLDIGFPPTEIAEDLGVSRQIVHQWKKHFEQHGLAGAKAKPHPGTTKIISNPQLEELKNCILEGALKHGFPSDAWTCPRVAALIQTRYKIDYGIRHVCYLMHQMGLSPQKPDPRALRRDEQKIQTWRLEILPRLKKNMIKGTR